MNAPGVLVTLIQPDERIPVITGLPLVDADPKAIARRLRGKSWDEVANFFDAIVAESLVSYAKLADFLVTEDERDAFTEFALLGMMRAVGVVLELFEKKGCVVTALADPGAIALCCLSLNPIHRRAARRWISGIREKTAAVFFAEVVAERWQALAVFFKLVEGMLPGAGQAWGRAMPTASGRGRP
jgi:hypothetical protein